jgi:Putative transposase
LLPVRVLSRRFREVFVARLGAASAAGELHFSGTLAALAEPAILAERLAADGNVDFTWKDYRDHGKTKVMTLSADEFIRRFLLHTVPDGFHRIRQIGFMANGHRTEKLALCRTLLTATTPKPAEAESYRDRTQRLAGHALDICPDCGRAMQQRGALSRRPPARQPFWCDSS